MLDSMVSLYDVNLPDINEHPIGTYSICPPTGFAHDGDTRFLEQKCEASNATFDGTLGHVYDVGGYFNCECAAPAVGGDYNQAHSQVNRMWVLTDKSATLGNYRWNPRSPQGNSYCVATPGVLIDFR